MATPVFKVKLTILKGSTSSQLVTWSTGATAETATPVDLTGCRARMQIRPDIDSSTVLVEFTTENGGIVLGGATGTIEFGIMSATETAALTWDSGVYDLEIIFSDGVTVLRKIRGDVDISPEVTHD